MILGWSYADSGDWTGSLSRKSQDSIRGSQHDVLYGLNPPSNHLENLIAQAETPAETKPPAEKTTEPKKEANAQEILKIARELLAKHDSIRAEMVETVHVADHSFKATGKYLQRGKMKLRLEFDLKLGETTGSMLEVCDGEILYTRQVIGKTPQLTRRNVREILEEAEKSNIPVAKLFIAEMGLGGLPGLLASLEQSMTFDVLQDDTLDDHSVWMIQGTWNDEMKNRLLPPKPPEKQEADATKEKPEADKQAKSEPEQPREFPALVPDHVRVFLDRKTGFPLKIQYLKKVAGRNFARPMLTLAFRNIKLNDTIDDSEFNFVPPETPTPFELTPLYKQRIQAAAAAAQQAAQQKQQQALPSLPAGIPAVKPPQQ